MEGIVGLREGRSRGEGYAGGVNVWRLMDLEVRRWGSLRRGLGKELSRPVGDGQCDPTRAPRRRTPPVVPHPAREDRASSSRERSTSRGRGAARSSSRDSGRVARGRGRPACPSPSPTGLCQPCAARGRGWDGLERWRHSPVTPAPSSLHALPLHPRWSHAPF